MSEARCRKVVIVEDDADLRCSLVFQLEGDGLCVSAYDSAEAFLLRCSRLEEGCIALDLNLPGMSGLMLLDRLARSSSRLVPIVMTGRGDVATAVRAMQAGAIDFIEKPFAPGDFRHSVLRALMMADRRIPLQRDTHEALSKYESLSDREREVFAGLVDGKQGKQIAIELGISPRTIEIHRARIMAKLNADSFSSLLRLGTVLEIGRRLAPLKPTWSGASAQSRHKTSA